VETVYRIGVGTSSGISGNCGSVMKRHFCPCCPLFKREGGNTPVISPRMPSFLSHY